MNNLFVLNEITTNGMDQSFLNLIGLVSILCGIFIIITKNPIVSVLFLIGLFISIAGYLMMLGINFIGLSYLLVYVGAVSILFLFILMLINVRISELVTENSNSIPLAVIISALVGMSQLYYIPEQVSDTVMQQIKPNYIYNLSVDNYTTLYPSDHVLTAISFCWDEKLAETSHITTIGNVIYTNYPIWLIITSIILLLAMVGSILITIKQ